MKIADTDCFDFIIVGAGTAGSVLGARLSDHGHNVLMLEAGERRNGVLVNIPAGFAVNLSNPAMLWELSTEAEAGTAGRRHRLPRGRGVGGSSLVNGMAYERGDLRDYDHWQALGCSGWGWGDVEPYFRRLENFEGDLPALGHDGPMRISSPRGLHPLTDILVDAAVQAGIRARPTLNDGDQEGVAIGDCTIGDGIRSSAYSAYLAKRLGRPNLVLRTGSTAERLIVEDDEARGVVCRDGDGTRRIFHAHEVILCAGALKTPQLLELSGIGDGGRLQRLGVPIARHVPAIGEALQDHYAVPFQFGLDRGGSMNDWTRLPGLLAQVLRYAWNRSGLLSFGASQARAFVRACASAERPDVLIHLAPASLDHESILRGKVAFERGAGVTLTPLQLRPTSRGSCHIASPDADLAPTITANYLATSIDQETIVAGLQFAGRIARQPALASLGIRPSFPREGGQDPAVLLDHARRHGSTLHHPAGSCAMGGISAPLDPLLRMRGIRGLRVVDASVMPALISAPIYAATLMIAEKAADLIRSGAGGRWPEPVDRR